MDDEVSEVRTHAHTWRVRSRTGAVRQVHSLAHMALLILDGKVDPRDEISASDGDWTPLEDVIDTQELATTLRALGHLGENHLAA